MKFDTLIRRLLLSIVAVAGLSLSSCVEEAIQPEEGFALYYPTITEIAPSMNFNVSPTWRGGSPSEFAIVSVTYDGQPMETECFAIDSEKGVFSISSSDNLPTGMYRISVSCVVDGRKYIFTDVILLELMKPVPDGIVVEPNSISVSLNDILAPAEDKVLPTAKVTSDGSNHVAIKDILIANIYLDGELYNDAKKWFNVTSEGEFSIIPENPAFEAGVYTFDLKVTTYFAGKDSEIGLFKNALTLNVTSAPTRVQYTPESLKVEFNVAGNSSAPMFKGSREGLTYEIKSVSPSNIGITVDPETGVLNFPQTDQVSVGDTYKVSLKVTNDFGTADFDDVFTFVIIEYLAPITRFSYANIDENISGVSFRNDVVEMDGDQVTYEWKTHLPEGLSKLTLDKQTGTVSNPKGSELPVGDYTLTVTATNAKGSKDASFTLKVVKNPNCFTYVRWGNNLGPEGKALLPLEKYGNQFRVFSSQGNQTFKPVESDIPEGAKVTYASDKPNGAMGGITIESDGTVTVAARTGNYETSQSVNIAVVTVGEGEAAVTRRFPIFADCYNEALGSISSPKGQLYVDIMYTPFVIRVNPKTGGLSDVVPTVTDKDGNDIKATSALDFDRNQAYYYIDGPAHHDNDTPLKNDADKVTFLVNVWERYLNAIQKPWNTYAAAMSYWENKDRLELCGGYVDDANDWRIRINPEKFVDADGNYANGVLYMTMSFNDSRTSPIQAKKYYCNRVLVWFDPTYTE